MCRRPIILQVAYTSSSSDYVIPRTRLKFGDRALALFAPLVWNNLKITKCTETVKRLLKMFFHNLNRHIIQNDNVMHLRSTVVGGALNRI